MPVPVRVNVLNHTDVVTLVKNRARLTQRQGERIGEGIEKALRGPYSQWPKKGGGVRGKASGASRVRFKSSVRNRGTAGITINITNTSTGRDRNRALGKKGGNRRRYARYPERGIPNPATIGRASKTVRKRLPFILKRVLGPGWDVSKVRK